MEFCLFFSPCGAYTTNGNKKLVPRCELVSISCHEIKGYDINFWYIGSLCISGLQELECFELKEIIDKMNPSLKKVEVGKSKSESIKNLENKALLIEEYLRINLPNYNPIVDVRFHNHNKDYLDELHKIIDLEIYHPISF